MLAVGVELLPDCVGSTVNCTIGKDHYLRENGALRSLSDAAVPLCTPAEATQEAAALLDLTPNVPNLMRHLLSCLDVRACSILVLNRCFCLTMALTRIALSGAGRACKKR